MKTIINTQTNIDFEENSEIKKMSYFDFIKLIINAPSKEGYNVEEIRQRLQILEIININKENSIIEFELNHFTLIKNSINSFKWVQIHKDIVMFIDYINSI